MDRITDLGAFWPYYLGEHRHPTDRALHFVGTTWFFTVLVACVVTAPVVFPPALLVGAGVTWIGSQHLERRGPAFLPMLAMLLVGGWANPLFLAGVGGAYACAWIGHFVVEKNRPATFRYPVWSFLCDFRMWSHMARGRMWSGDPAAGSAEPG